MRKTTIKKITQGLLPLMVMAGLWLLGSCSPTPRNAQTVNRLPQIYPDYTDVTIPPNIAPLNFMLCDSADAVTAATTRRCSMRTSGTGCCATTAASGSPCR